MKQAFIKEFISSGLNYAYSDYIDPGEILVVSNICAWWSGIGNNEEVMFFVEVRGVLHYLGDDQPAVNDAKASWGGEAFCGEQGRVGIYAPDAVASDVIYLWVFGELWDLESWRKAT